MELFRVGWVKGVERALLARFLTIGSVRTASLLLATVTAYGRGRLVFEVERIRVPPRVQESVVMAKIRQYDDRTKRAYTRQAVYSFHARLLMVPELAVKPVKRIWSGQITCEQVFSWLDCYKPEQLLLTEDSFLNNDVFKRVGAVYSLVHRDGSTVLYVAKSLNAHER